MTIRSDSRRKVSSSSNNTLRSIRRGQQKELDVPSQLFSNRWSREGFHLWSPSDYLHGRMDDCCSLVDYPTGCPPIDTYPCSPPSPGAADKLLSEGRRVNDSHTIIERWCLGRFYTRRLLLSFTCETFSRVFDAVDCYQLS